MFGPTTAAEMRTAQILTGLAMALFISVRLVPGLRPYVRGIQAAVLTVYLVGCAVLVVHALIR